MIVAHQTEPQPFYRFPESTKVNRTLPKNKIYEQVKANSATRELFINQVEQISWAYKLSPQTLNIEANEQFSEVQVFKVKLKDENVAEEVLQTIDKAIPHPIIFEVITVSNKVKTTACFKSIGVNGGVTLSEYYSSDWKLNAAQLEEGGRVDLPLSLNTKTLYEQLLASLLPYQLRDNETFQALIKRIDNIKLLEHKQQKINKQLSNEKQFKNKVKINTELKDIKNKLKQLKHTA